MINLTIKRPPLQIPHVWSGPVCSARTQLERLENNKSPTSTHHRAKTMTFITPTTPTNTLQEPPFSRGQDESVAYSSACPVTWLDLHVPNSTTFDPTGAKRLKIVGAASVACSDPQNADYQFTIFLWASDSPGLMQDPATALRYLAYNSNSGCHHPPTQCHANASTQALITSTTPHC